MSETRTEGWSLDFVQDHQSGHTRQVSGNDGRLQGDIDETLARTITDSFRDTAIEYIAQHAGVFRVPLNENAIAQAVSVAERASPPPLERMSDLYSSFVAPSIAGLSETVARDERGRFAPRSRTTAEASTTSRPTPDNSDLNLTNSCFRTDEEFIKYVNTMCSVFYVSPNHKEVRILLSNSSEYYNYDKGAVNSYLIGIASEVAPSERGLRDSMVAELVRMKRRINSNADLESSYQRNILSAKSYLTDHRRSISNANHDYLALIRAKSRSLDYVAIVKEILKDEFYSLQTVDDTKVFFITKPVTISHIIRSSKVDQTCYMGKYRIMLDFDSCIITVQQWEDNIIVSGCPHPNVNESGGICWGNGSVAAEQMSQGIFKPAFEALRSILTSYGTPPYVPLESFISARKRLDIFVNTTHRKVGRLKVQGDIFSLKFNLNGLTIHDSRSLEVDLFQEFKITDDGIIFSHLDADKFLIADNNATFVNVDDFFKDLNLTLTRSEMVDHDHYLNTVEHDEDDDGDHGDDSDVF